MRGGRMRSWRASAALGALVLLMSACGSAEDAGSGGAIRVVASAYPLAEAAERVGGNLVSVENLTPPGAEPHDLELAPDDIEALLTADLVLFVGGGFQPAVEEAAADAQGPALAVIDAVATLPPPDEEHSEEEAGEHGELVADPHVWLDPGRYADIVGAIAGALAEVDPANSAAYGSGAAAFQEEIGALDAEFRERLASCDVSTIVVNHAAFGYLADAYGLVQESISGVSPESEPGRVRLAELRDLVEREGVTTIFTEELLPPDVAETLAAEAGVKTAVLNPLEGLTQDQLEAGEDYGSIMRRNLETLREALGCA